MDNEYMQKAIEEAYEGIKKEMVAPLVRLS